MNSHLRPLFAAAALAMALHAPSTLAGLMVSVAPTPATVVGNKVSFTLSVLDDGATPTEVTLSAIESWDFKLAWGAAPLTLNKANSKFVIGGNTYNGFSDLFTLFFPPNSLGGENYLETSGTGFYTFAWADMTDFNTLNLANGFVFDAEFDIDAGAAPGTYGINFGEDAVPSGLSSDFGANQFTYPNTSVQRNPTVQVVLNAHPAPEPGMLGLLVGGLGALAAMRLRRRSSQ
jgi:hypothetical protein